MSGSPRNRELANCNRSQAFGAAMAVVCGLILVRSAMFHMENPFGFLATVYSYDILPRSGGIAVAAILPPTQLVLGLLLVLFPQHRGISLRISGLLFLLLAVVQIVTISRGLNISCGCFGPSIDENPIGAQSIGLAIGCGLFAFVSNWSIRDETTK